MSNLSSIICNDHYCNITLCISNDRNVYSFGKDKYGANGHIDEITFPPKQIKDLCNIKMISCGCYHTICIDYDGNIYSFGRNNYGQLGIGKSKNELKFTHKPQKLCLPLIKQISCGYYFTMCLSYDGNLYGFGHNYEGQLGLGNNNDAITPQIIPSFNNNVEYVECGAHHVICKTINDEFYSWGDNEQGQLGQILDNIPKEGFYNSPMKCNNWPDNIICIRSGLYHTLLLTSSAQIYSFGYNGSGQLGLNNKQNKFKIPTLIKDLPSIKRIECGYYHSMCIDLEDNLWIFGDNSKGQLGLGNYIDYCKPTKFYPLQNILDISSGGYHTFVKTIDNKIYSFGYNDYSQIGIKTKGNEQLTPLQVFQDKEDIWCSFLGKSKQKSARK